MPIDFAADLDEMLSVDNHGITVTRQKDSATFEAILNNEYFRQELGEAGIDTTEQALYAKTNDVDDLVKGDHLTISGTSHVIASIEPDGTGLTRLVLHD